MANNQPVGDPEPLLSAVSYKTRLPSHVRATAITALRYMDLTEEQKERAASGLVYILNRAEENSTGTVLLMVITIGFTLLMIAVASYETYNSSQISSFICLVSVPFLVRWPFYEATFHAQSVLHAAIFALSGVGGIAAVEVLAPAYLAGDRQTSEAAGAALCEVLGRVTPNDAGILDHRSLELLGRIPSVADPQLALLVYNAFGQIAPASYAYVVEVALQQPLSDVLRTAAERAKAAIEEREARKRDRKTLLRPSTAPAENTLLRPAANAGDTPKELLLRPSDDDGK